MSGTDAGNVESGTGVGDVESETDAGTGERWSPVERGARRFRAADRRERIELAGVAVVAVLATVMVGFVALDWLRLYPHAGAHPVVESFYAATRIDPVAGLLFEQFLVLGAWADYLLGTNVFEHPFMWRSIATGVLVGVVTPLVGTYLVHREMALIGETLAHTAFAGVAIGVVVMGATGWNGSLLLVALVVAVAGALGVKWLADRTDTYGDVPIAIVLSGSFAVGTLLISWGRGATTASIDVEGYLFGSIAVVTPDGARLMAALSVAVVALVARTYKQLLFITFDEQAARVARLDVDRYNTLLVVLTAVVVVGAMQILGVILVAAMLVVPVAAATHVARSFRETLYLSVLLGQLSVVGGFAVAIGGELPTGGSIVVVAIAIYLLAIGLSGRSATMSTR